MRGNIRRGRSESALRVIWFGASRNVCLGAAFLLGIAMSAHALPRRGMVDFRPSRDSLCVVERDHVSPIYVDPGDFAGVAKAANDLAQDVGRVSGRAAAVVGATDEATSAGPSMASMTCPRI